MWGLIALLIFAGIVIALYFLGLLVPVALFIGAGILVTIFYKFFVKKFDPYEAALVYRFGRFQRVSPSGWAIVVPVIEKVGATVDLREQQEKMEIDVISEEGLKLHMVAMVQFYINNAVKAILNIKDYRQALLNLVESRVRDLAAEFTFTQILVNVEDISAAMKEEIFDSVDNWGIALTTFEIEHIHPPEQIMEALKGKRVAAENLEAKKFIAEARRILTAALGDATKSFDDKTISYLYIKALENMKSAKMMVPAEFLDVVKPSAGGSGNLARGMIAGTTYNKALNMIEQEVVNEGAIGKRTIHEKLKEIAPKEETEAHSKEEEKESEEQEHESNEQAATADSADGDIDGKLENHHH